jgi:hypothetical protein
MPEPSTTILIGIGLFGLTVKFRKHRRRCEPFKARQTNGTVTVSCKRRKRVPSDDLKSPNAGE